MVPISLPSHHLKAILGVRVANNSCVDPAIQWYGKGPGEPDACGLVSRSSSGTPPLPLVLFSTMKPRSNRILMDVHIGSGDLISDAFPILKKCSHSRIQTLSTEKLKAKATM